MEPLAKNEMKDYAKRENEVKTILFQAFSLIKDMVNLKDEVEDDDINKAILETTRKNPEIREELEQTKKELNREPNTEKKYNELENKLKDIKAQVSETQAKNQTEERPEGGKQKTREDED